MSQDEPKPWEQLVGPVLALGARPGPTQPSRTKSKLPQGPAHLPSLHFSNTHPTGTRCQHADGSAPLSSLPAMHSGQSDPPHFSW